jgi:cell division transport system permease protein
MLAVVVYLGTLATVGIVIVESVLGRWQGGSYASITVQLPSNTELATVEDVLETLNQTPGVEQARAISREEMIWLLEPWFAAGDLIKQLPIPWLIDVVPKEGAVVNWPATQNRLAEHVPGVLVDTGMVWLEKLTQPARTFQVTAILVLALIILATVAAVSLTARAALAIHRDTIEVIHLLGAEDDYIIRQIQRRVTGMAARGSIVGVVLASATIFAIGYVTNHVEASLFPIYEFGVGGWVAMFAMPLLAVIIAAFTVRRIVGRELASML